MEDMGFLGNFKSTLVEQCCVGEVVHGYQGFLTTGQIGNLSPHMLSWKISSEIARG